jgi:hypothetical protein
MVFVTPPWPSLTMYSCQCRLRISFLLPVVIHYFHCLFLGSVFPRLGQAEPASWCPVCFIPFIAMGALTFYIVLLLF